MSHLIHTTVAQAKYLERATSEKGIVYPSFLERIEKDRAALEDPEAGWDLADLIASGKTFPYNWFGETRYHIPDNTFLTGFKAIQYLISSYGFLGGFYQAAWGNTAKAKESLYLAAYCQEKLCRWPIEDQYRVTECLVDLNNIDKFLMGVLADADDRLLEELGELLCPDFERAGTSIGRRFPLSVFTKRKAACCAFSTKGPGLPVIQHPD